ncbi:MAG: TraR/DksA C4-type zinc finger protein [Pseudomonadales bacterium]
MPDILDQAKDTEMMLRDNSIAAAQANAACEPAQEVIDGRVVCIDCDEPVQQARLAVKPNAARCIYCQQRAEQQGKHYELGRR